MDFNKKSSLVGSRNLPVTVKKYRKRDGSEGHAFVISFSDSETNKSYTVQITKEFGEPFAQTKKGRPIVGYASVAKFVRQRLYSNYNTSQSYPSSNYNQKRGF